MPTKMQKKLTKERNKNAAYKKTKRTTKTKLRQNYKKTTSKNIYKAKINAPNKKGIKY